MCSCNAQENTVAIAAENVGEDVVWCALFNNGEVLQGISNTLGIVTKRGVEGYDYLDITDSLVCC